MSSCDDFIEKARKELPDPCSTQDLVRFGIYKSDQAAHNARKNGSAADYFRLPHGTIMYPKKGIINLLESSKHSCETLENENHNTRKPHTQSKSQVQKKGIRL